MFFMRNVAMKEISSLQQLIACLTTHPHHLKTALRNPEQFITKFNQFTPIEKQDFLLFFNTYSQRLKATTSLFSKKRLEEVEIGLELTHTLFPEVIWKSLWQSYISGYSLEESIPENPLLDAIRFLVFIKDNKKFPSLVMEFIAYQIIKLNLILKIEHIKIPSQEKDYNASKEKDKITFQLNNTIVISKFSHKLSEVIKEINRDKKVLSEQREFMGEEYLLVYINRYKKTVSTIALSNYLLDLLQVLEKINNFPDCFNEILTKNYPIKEENFKRDLNKLATLDILNFV